MPRTQYFEESGYSKKCAVILQADLIREYSKSLSVRCGCI